MRIALKSIIFIMLVTTCIISCKFWKGKKKFTRDSLKKTSIRYEPVTGIGPEENILRRDPSDIIFVNGLYYVWYTKVTSENYNYPEGHQGTIWYASSPDGINWKEQKKVLDIGEAGNFDDFGVYTPNILYVPKNKKYYLYYTGIQADPENPERFKGGGSIGVAVADAVDGGDTGWKKANGSQQILRTPEHREAGKFGARHVDDAALVVKNGKYYLYHKGSPSREEREKLNLPRGATPMALAISDTPDGIFTPHPLDSIQGFLIQAGHEVLIWKYGEELAALPAGHYRPKTKDDFKIHLSKDGIHFNPIGDEVINIRESETGGLRAPGAFRPDLVNPDTTVTGLKWGLSMTSYQAGAGLQRFILEH